MSAKVDERIQGIILIETYGYGTNKEVVYRKEEIKCINIMKQNK